MVKNVENEALIDAESKKTRDANIKRQERAKERMIEEIDLTPEELEAVKARRKINQQKMEAQWGIGADGPPEKKKKRKPTFPKPPSRIKTKTITTPPDTPT